MLSSISGNDPTFGVIEVLLICLNGLWFKYDFAH